MVETGKAKEADGKRTRRLLIEPFPLFPNRPGKAFSLPGQRFNGSTQTSGSGLHGLSDFFMQPMLPGEEKSRRRSDEDGGVRTNQNACGNRPGEVFHGRTSKEVQAHQHGQRGKRGQNSTENVWLMASFMICEALSFGSEKRRNSRMRSNTIILSLMEYPATVNNAPI